MPASSGRSRLAWRFAHVLMTLAFGSAVGACFNAPSGAVLFACDANTAPSCPDGYTCEADDCCHRDGSDIEAELGSCRIGGGMSGTTSSSGPTGSGPTSSGPTSSSGADTGSSTSTSADTGSSGAGTTT